jgi:hypothetical protein
VRRAGCVRVSRVPCVELVVFVSAQSVLRKAGAAGRPRLRTFLLPSEQYRTLEKLKVLLPEPALCGLLATLTSMQLITHKGLLLYNRALGVVVQVHVVSTSKIE